MRSYFPLASASKHSQLVSIKCSLEKPYIQRCRFSNTTSHSFADKSESGPQVQGKYHVSGSHNAPQTGWTTKHFKVKPQPPEKGLKSKTLKANPSTFPSTTATGSEESRPRPGRLPSIHSDDHEPPKPRPKHVLSAEKAALQLSAQMRRAATTERDQPYVLTLKTNHSHSAALTALRTKYFPPRLLVVPRAHLTLFHALPGSKLDSHVIPTLTSFCATQAPFTVLTDWAKHSARRVFITVASSPEKSVERLIGTLQDAWKSNGEDEQTDTGLTLTPQDARSPALTVPHYTITNNLRDKEMRMQCWNEARVLVKTAKRKAEATGDDERENWAGLEGQVSGVTLWRYQVENDPPWSKNPTTRRGSWTWFRDFEFSGKQGGREGTTRRLDLPVGA